MIAALTNHLWQSTLFVVAAALVAAALRANGAHVRHRVWLAASLKFLVPFSLLLSLGGLLPRFGPAVAPAIATQSAPNLSVAVDRIAQPFTSGAFLSGAPASAGATMNWPAIVLGLWACGFVAVMVLRVREWRRVRAAVRASVSVLSGGLKPAGYESEYDGAGLQVRSAPGLLEPGIVGIFRPVLLLPAGIDEQLTPAQLRAVVAHELCHVARRDNLTSAMHMVVEAVFWFHPLVWWVGARLVDERERACDEHVLRVCGAPGTYAESILNVCRLYVESRLACVSGVRGLASPKGFFGGGGSHLKKRIGAIVAGRVGGDLSGGRKAMLALAAAVALAAPIAAGVVTAPLRVSGQTADPQARFEVVSVRPCDPDAPRTGGRSGGAGGVSPGRVYLDCESAWMLIRTAYVTYPDGRYRPAQEQAAYPMPNEVPDWVSHERYTIEAKAEGEPPRTVMIGPMLQRVLEERFKVKVHRETREVPVYEVVAAKGGVKVSPPKLDECVPYDMSVSPQPPLPPGKHRCNERAQRQDPDGRWVYDYEALTLDDFFNGRGPNGVDPVLGRRIVNHSGVTGLVSFRWVSVNGPTPDDYRSALARGLRDQLGLELREAKAPRNFLVIDHVERPTPDPPAPIAPSGRGDGAAGDTTTRPGGAR